MTPDEALVEIASTCPWFADADMAALLSPDVAPDELALILATYQAQGIPPTGPSSWETVLKILAAVGTIAGAVLPAVGVVQALVNVGRS